VISLRNESPSALKSIWSLRRAHLADAEFVAKIFASSRRAAMPYLSQLYTELQVLKWIEDVVLRNTVVTLAVDDRRNVGGFASVQSGVLEQLYVAPRLQGQGLGSHLLAAAKEESPRGLRLHVFQRNLSARRFYEQRGF
jgi:putative acetyltransferase